MKILTNIFKKKKKLPTTISHGIEWRVRKHLIVQDGVLTRRTETPKPRKITHDVNRAIKTVISTKLSLMLKS